MKCVLGIDTSNYTTSVCAVSAADGTLLANARMLLPVTDGQRGLRQSDALFFHVRQLPMVMGELMQQLHVAGIHPEWVAAGVSVRPRPYASSYMPVFQAGASFATSFAQAVGIPLVHTSHQEGHLAAAEHFVPVDGRRFVAVHISGGTSDVMIAQRTAFGYKIDLVGEGLDLHAGQFVDRVGVHLGLPFPAGKALERLASSEESQFVDEQPPFALPASVHGARMSFSGPLSAAIRALDRGTSPALVANAVQRCIAQSVAKAVEYTIRQHDTSVREVLVAGGVASNATIRHRVTERLTKRVRNVRVQFAPAEFARDNALGVAHIAQVRFRG
ncbi:peptidase M22 [Alicyclobacillus fastidiosus]|uniref:N(6)-L-threonylcarbamoyladenine synthase n=1 Tax=Alicyclobacillus fastidiosus TaxID=392011 RepID=A0ABY6ZQS0_9BACL|nr:peptidase M22 [Alicyclobacillus fastidiosus]WAH44300.1 peptidase M22 [Alicyclobacillus fastidiosus]GMA60624.1 O-sialoglycoprotein endopeptidase [Alicyclobacillus fastidiosus]